MNSKDEKIRENICKFIFDEFMNVTKVLPQLTKLEPTLVNIIPIYVSITDRWLDIEHLIYFVEVLLHCTLVF